MIIEKAEIEFDYDMVFVFANLSDQSYDTLMKLGKGDYRKYSLHYERDGVNIHLWYGEHER